MGKARQLPCYHTGRGFLWSLARLRSAVRLKSCYLPEVFNRGRRGRQSYKTLPTTSGNDQYSGENRTELYAAIKEPQHVWSFCKSKKKKASISAFEWSSDSSSDVIRYICTNQSFKRKSWFTRLLCWNVWKRKHQVLEYNHHKSVTK